MISGTLFQKTYFIDCFLSGCMFVQTILEGGRFDIPEEIRDRLGIKDGDEIEIQVDDDRMILSKKKNQDDIFAEISKR